MTARTPARAPDSTPGALADLARLAAEGHPRVLAYGAEGSFLACAAACVTSSTVPGPLVILVPEERAAAAMARDVAFFLPPGTPVLELPAMDTSPYSEVTPDRALGMRRLATLHRLARGQAAGTVVVLSAESFARRVIPRAGLVALSATLRAGQPFERDEYIARLVGAGYTRVPLVEDAGTFAVRGGVLDIFSPLHGQPARIELDGDLIETIRLFDPDTQRTTRTVDSLEVPPVREAVRTEGARIRPAILEAADATSHPTTRTRLIIEQAEAGEDFLGIEGLAPAFHARLDDVTAYLPPTARWLVVDPPAVRAAITDLWAAAYERYEECKTEHRLALPPIEHWLDEDEVAARLVALPRIESLPLETVGEDSVPVVRFRARPNYELAQALTRARSEHADHLLEPLVARIAEARAAGTRVVLVCSGMTHAERLRGLLQHGYQLEPIVEREPGAHGLWEVERGGPPHIFLGPLKQGFEAPDDGLLLVAEDEIFGARTTRTAARPGKKSIAKAFTRGLDDFADLMPGEFVVHVHHGIGRYLGLVKLPIAPLPGQQPVQIDFLHLEYAGGSLYLPVYRLAEVSRFVGTEGVQPRLDRLGGVTWDKTKRKVTAEVKKLAEDLLKLYAQRKALPGFAFPPRDDMFTEFEATFAFEETADQQQAIDDVVADMEQPRPMDRMVCGDVGYGKTEVAIRAAFKAVTAGRQVAVLAPTTVLVEQHGQTFRERFQGWPVKVATLSRFLPRKEALEVLDKLARGQVDVVIGTHRLLSKDVRFKDLGLLVVDEEQKFGVTHKERIKAMRTQLDVLTLTATPIPRTLQMSLMGLREVSIISTPPVDRMAIRTYVSRATDDVVRDAVRKEMARGGQTFFVCHYINGAYRGDRSIMEWAEHIRTLVPEARVSFAHGQLSPEELERAMVDFVAHKADVLVCTAIIESGIDIPRANTMLINQAEVFGLAQLYQLRGRIGRSKVRAYCYLMIPSEESLTPEAKQRLATLQRFTELGAGFQIASHDLEIRGAGELLGPNQSGHVAQVGFEQYASILEEAVAELKGEPIVHEKDPELSTDVPAYIPDDYVPDTGQRLDLYKRLSGAADEDEVSALIAEMRDRFGDPPSPVHLLAELMIVKAHARVLQAVALDLGRDRMILTFPPDGGALSPATVAGLVGERGSAFRLTPDSRLVRTFTQAERNQPIGAARTVLAALRPQAA